jgi:phosphatidylserine/phosphatidylglycerophosphate/cardiolipin synthase-like enzyme
MERLLRQPSFIKRKKRNLDTKNVEYSVNNIIKNSEEWVMLISPYIDLYQIFRDLIAYRNEEGVKVVIMYGKKKNQYKFNSDVKSWIKSMKNVAAYFIKDLHAKCYLNEKEAVITSMNLYDASKRNVEMGILVTKNEDKELYGEIRKEANRLLRICGKSNHKNDWLLHEIDPKYGSKGYCIRCGKRIKLDVKSPYCKKDWIVWKKIGNESYEEKDGVCHICGKSNKSSMKKPVCKSCYNTNKHLFS